LAARRSYDRPIPAAEAGDRTAVTDRELKKSANRRYA
jgi:hypothetical protein